MVTRLSVAPGCLVNTQCRSSVQNYKAQEQQPSKLLFLPPWATSYLGVCPPALPCSPDLGGWCVRGTTGTSCRIVSYRIMLHHVRSCRVISSQCHTRYLVRSYQIRGMTNCTHLNPPPCAVFLTGGGGTLRGEIFAVKKGGERFPWRNFGGIVPSFTTAAGIVFPEKGQALVRTRPSPPLLAQMRALELETKVLGPCRGTVVHFGTPCLVHVLLCCCSHLGVWHLEHWGSQVVLLQPFGGMALGALGFSSCVVAAIWGYGTWSIGVLKLCCCSHLGVWHLEHWGSQVVLLQPFGGMALGALGFSSCVVAAIWGYGTWSVGDLKLCCCSHLGVWHLERWGSQVVLLQPFGGMALGALGISRAAKLSPGEIPPPLHGLCSCAGVDSERLFDATERRSPLQAAWHHPALHVHVAKPVPVVPPAEQPQRYPRTAARVPV